MEKSTGLTAEEILRLLPDGIMVVDGENRILQWNPACEEIYGYTAEEAIGRQASFLHDPRFRDAVGDGIVSEVIRSGVITVQAPALRKDGTPVQIEVTGRPLMNEQGEPVCVIGVNRDVTGRLAAPVLRRGTETDRHIAESIPKIVWTATPSGAIDYCNTQWLEYTGLTWEETRDWAWRLAIHPDDLDTSLTQWSEARKNGSTFQMEQRLRRHDGTYRWHLTRAIPIRSESGEVAQWFGAMTDIHDQKLAQEEARRAVAQLEVILKGVTDGVLATDRSGRYIYANEAGARISGFSSVKEMLAHTSEEVIRRLELFDEEGRPFPLEQLPNRQAMTGVKEPPEVVLQFRFKGQKETRWSILNARPVFDENGEVIFVVSIFRDFTDRKRHEIEREKLLTQVRRQEAQARLLDDTTRILTSSLDYEITLDRAANLAVERLGGWVGVSLLDEHGQLRELAVAHTDAAKLPLVKTLREKFPTPVEESVEYAVLASGEPHFAPEVPDELLVQRARGPEHLALLRELGLKGFISVPLKVKQGTLGVINFASSTEPYDETDLNLATEFARRASLAIENARLFRQAQEAVRIRDEFLSVASHELKTPLTPLKLQIQILGRILKTGDISRIMANVEKVIDTSDRQISRLSKLIDDLLDIGRISTGRLKLNRETFELSEFLKEVADRYQSQVSASRCALEMSFPSEIVGRWDRLRLEQVVANLLTNAMRYAPGSRIRVSAEQLGGNALVRVHDEGSGISPLDQGRIFERFERVHPDKDAGGLGLGLYISRQIVEAHGGSIRVESSLGHGATFVVELPLDG